MEKYFAGKANEFGAFDGHLTSYPSYSAELARLFCDLAIHLEVPLSHLSGCTNHLAEPIGQPEPVLRA